MEGNEDGWGIPYVGKNNGKDIRFMRRFITLVGRKTTYLFAVKYKGKRWGFLFIMVWIMSLSWLQVKLKGNPKKNEIDAKTPELPLFEVTKQNKK